MTQEPLQEISKSLEKTLTDSDLGNIAINLAEIPFDKLLENGVLKDIPIFSTLIGLGKTAVDIRDLLFLKKIIYFISEISTVPISEREAVINEIDKSQKYRVRVGEKLIYIIDKSEDYKSCEIIAKLFAAFLKKKITYPQFLKSSKIVNDVFIDDLKKFVDDERQYNFRVEDIGDLFNSGLFDIEMDPVDVRVEDQDDYKRSNQKYKTDVDGGTLRANISSIGEIIKEILKNQIN